MISVSNVLNVEKLGGCLKFWENWKLIDLWVV